MTDILGLLLAIAGMLIAVLALREVRAIKMNDSLPYQVRNGLEDLIAPVLRAKMRVEQERRELEVFLEILGELRNGDYKKDQPHKPRK